MLYTIHVLLPCVSKHIVCTFLKWERQIVPNLCVTAGSPEKLVAALKRKRKNKNLRQIAWTIYWDIIEKNLPLIMWSSRVLPTWSAKEIYQAEKQTQKNQGPINPPFPFSFPFLCTYQHLINKEKILIRCLFDEIKNSKIMKSM